MKLWPSPAKPEESKAHPAGAAFAMIGGGNSWQRPSNAKAYIDEGYQLNVIVYRAVREIANACADLTVEVFQNGEALDVHPALELMKRPNPMQGGDTFIKEAFTNYLLTGEVFIVGTDENPPAELWNLNPVNMEVKPGAGGVPSAYVHCQNNVKTEFPVDRVTGQAQVFCLKMYNPNDYWRGQSPMMAAALAADTHNEGVKWNYKLLRNSARPSGFMKFTGVPGDDVISRLREWFRATMQGSENAGEIGVIGDGGEWQAMSENPKDMDFMNTQKEMAKLVASAFGVPLPLIDNDSTTFNNMEQAKERFYTDTILPMFNEFLRAFGNWLLPRFGQGLEFRVDLDDVAALEGVRNRTFERMLRAKQAGVLTVDEARAGLNYPELTPEQRLELDPVGAAIASADGQTQDAIRSAAKLTYG
jgi:HK97 family phage portal protein